MMRAKPKRWAVPRPGRDGKPIGILRIEVVPAEAYDRLREAFGDLLDAVDEPPDSVTEFLEWEQQA